MFNSISVGPPQGPPSWSSSKPDKVEETKESFDRTLAEKVSSKSDMKVSDRKVLSKDEKKEEVVSQNPLQKRAAALRQKAIEGFMDSFESEFNVPPTRLVEAMAQLPAADLLKNPEETVDSVLAQLDLTEEQEIQAKEMYLNLVSDLNRIDKASQPPVVVTADANAMMGSQLKERFVVAQEKKSILNQSLEKMNNNFFMKPAIAPSPTSPVVAKPLEQEVLQNNWDGFEAAMDLENKLGEDPALFKDPSKTFQDLPGIENPTESGSSMKAKSAGDNNVTGTSLLEQLKKLTEPQTQLENFAAPGTEIPLEAPLQAPMQASVAGLAVKNAQAQQQQGEGFSQKNSGMNGGNENSKKDSEVASSGDSLNLLGASEANSFRTSTAETSKPFMSTPMTGATGLASMGENKEGPSDINIRQIMNQAQYLIKKGGGEVKVEMSPDGLGLVHLKMAIQDGKVNLQMATETPEAKQAIESGMSDLKSSLAAHKLSVDHVKVDVVNSSSAGSAADNSSQSFNQQAQRDSTRQFWNQFQENFGNRSQREGFSEAPGLKGYGTKRSDPLAPVEGTSTAKSRSVEGKGNGLNLVA